MYMDLDPERLQMKCMYSLSTHHVEIDEATLVLRSFEQGAALTSHGVPGAVEIIGHNIDHIQGPVRGKQGGKVLTTDLNKLSFMSQKLLKILTGQVWESDKQNRCCSFRPLRQRTSGDEPGCSAWPPSQRRLSSPDERQHREGGIFSVNSRIHNARVVTWIWNFSILSICLFVCCSLTELKGLMGLGSRYREVVVVYLVRNSFEFIQEKWMLSLKRKAEMTNEPPGKQSSSLYRCRSRPCWPDTPSRCRAHRTRTASGRRWRSWWRSDGWRGFQPFGRI